MDKSEGKDWFAKTLNNVTEETAKVYKISRLKFETGTLTKAKNEKMSVMARKLMQLINEGRIEEKLFEPEFSSIISIEKKKEEIEEEIANIKGNLKIGFGKNHRKDYDDDDDIIKIVDTERTNINDDNENKYEKNNK